MTIFQELRRASEAQKKKQRTRKVGPDFHLVALTADGKALAAGSPLRISNGRISILFPADGQPVKIARYEWDMLLRDHAHADGSKLCAIVVDDEPEPTVDDVTVSHTAPKENE